MKELIANGRKIDLRSPIVMGIINLTPDSFYDGGKYQSSKKILKSIDQMISDGVRIVDLGAASSKPGAEEISEKEEMKRLLPVLKLVRNTYPNLFVSVDTYRSGVALASSECGADMINDIGAGVFDAKMWKIIQEINLPYVMMHSQGKPSVMQRKPRYKNVTLDIFDFFKKRCLEAKEMGIHQIVLDPGFGFGKTLEHNYQLLNELEKFSKLGFPLLVGLSRKSMIYSVLENKPEDALNGTTVLNTIALLKGCKILRVHDVKEAKEAIKLVEFFKKVSN